MTVRYGTVYFIHATESQILLGWGIVIKRYRQKNIRVRGDCDTQKIQRTTEVPYKEKI